MTHTRVLRRVLPRRRGRLALGVHVGVLPHGRLALGVRVGVHLAVGVHVGVGVHVITIDLLHKGIDLNVFTVIVPVRRLDLVQQHLGCVDVDIIVVALPMGGRVWLGSTEWSE